MAYAKYVVLLIAEKLLQIISDPMQGALVKLSKDGHEPMGVNQSFVLFMRKRKLPDLLPPSLNGVTLGLSSKAKYIGTVLDQRLNSKRNLEELAKMGIIALYSGKNSVGRSWGLKSNIIKWLYNLIVRPLLVVQFGGTIWGSLPSVQTLIKSKEYHLYKLQVHLGAQSALNTLLNLKPLSLFGEEQASRCALRLKELDQWRQLFNYSDIRSWRS